MQPQLTLPFSAGSSATINITQWQLKYGYFGNKADLMVCAKETDISGAECWRQLYDYTPLFYKDLNGNLDRVSIIIGADPLYTDIEITIK